MSLLEKHSREGERRSMHCFRDVHPSIELFSLNAVHVGLTRTEVTMDRKEDNHEKFFDILNMFFNGISLLRHT